MKAPTLSRIFNKPFYVASHEVNNRQFRDVLNEALTAGFIEVDDSSAPVIVRNVALDPRDGVTVWQQQQLIDLDSPSCQLAWGDDGGARSVNFLHKRY